MSEIRKPAWKRTNDVRPKFERNLCPLEVVVRDNDITQALKVLKNKMSKDGILGELKTRRFAEKPSEKKRRKHREALKKLRKSRGRKARQRFTGSES